MQRLDSSVLKRDLEYLQQAVIYIRQTKIQLKLNQTFKKYEKKNGLNNFLERYSKLFPINNHPGCLVIRHEQLQSENQERNNKLNMNLSSYDNKVNEADDIMYMKTTNCNDRNTLNNNKKTDEIEWWGKVYEKYPNMGDFKNGGKVLILIQILAHADVIGDKVVVFSQCLRTLDFIEHVLQTPNWDNRVPSISELSPGKVWGGWRKNIDYLRIDGSTDAKVSRML